MLADVHRKNLLLLANLLLWTGFMVDRISVILWLRFIYRNQEGIEAEKLKWWQVPMGLFAVTWTALAEALVTGAEVFSAMKNGVWVL